MIRFESDYLEGAHPKIMKRLMESNFDQTPGYGNDTYCEKAREVIKKLCKREDADVHFLVGGTQTNTTVIAAALRPYQGVVCADTGHINVHETGAIEATGHKVLALPSTNGKITAKQVVKAMEAHYQEDGPEHMVQPGMVYISHPTEVGTLYTKQELSNLSEVCRKYNIPLFLDGARLGYGLTSEANDLSIEDIANYCDVFYIGGTKVGALFGEAVVICNESLKKDFRYSIKQRGGMLAKGRLLGIQFLTLLEDGLYFEIANHANQLAMKIRRACEEKGYPFFMDSYTNQQFPIIPNEKLKELEKAFSYSFWEAVDAEHSAVRFCTSWATKEEDVVALLRKL